MLSTICRRVACNARPLCRKSFSSEVIVTFVDPIQGKLPVAGKVGESLLTVAHDNDIDLEGVFSIQFLLFQFVVFPTLRLLMCEESSSIFQ